MRACGRGPLQAPSQRTLGPGGHDERPSSESSLLVAASGGRAGAKRSRPERPALSKSAVGPARDCGPPGSGAPLGTRSPGRGHSSRCSRPDPALCRAGDADPRPGSKGPRTCLMPAPLWRPPNGDGRSRAKRFSSRFPQRPVYVCSDVIPWATGAGSVLLSTW